MSDENDKAATDIRFIEKALKVAWVFYGLALFFYVVGSQSDGNLGSKTAAALFLGLFIYCLLMLTVWRIKAQRRRAPAARKMDQVPVTCGDHVSLGDWPDTPKRLFPGRKITEHLMIRPCTDETMCL